MTPPVERHEIRVAWNAIYTFGRNLVCVPIFLILTPYIVSRIGIDQFGIWALSGLLSSYVQLSDFGMGESLVRFFSETGARGDSARTSRLLNTSLVLATGFAAASLAIFLFSLDFIIVSVLSIPAAMRRTAHLVFSISILAFSLNILSGVFSSLIIGFQRMDRSNAILAGSAVLNALGTVFFLELGYGLPGLAWNNLLTTLLVLVLNWGVSRSLLPGFRLDPFRSFRREEARAVLSYGWKVQVTALMQILIFQIDRVLISNFIGLTAVAQYEIANRFASAGRALIASLFSPIIPAASAMQARDEHDLLGGLYRRGFKYMSALCVPSFLLLAALAKPLLRTMMGPGYDMSACTLQILCIAFMVNLFTAPGTFVAAGANRPDLSMKTAAAGGILNVALCLLLVSTAGYYGIPFGILVSLLASGLLFLRVLHSEFPGIGTSVYRPALARPLAASLLAGGALAAFDAYFPLSGYVSIGLLAAAGAGLVGLSLLAGGYFDDFDRSLLRSLFPFLGKAPAG